MTLKRINPEAKLYHYFERSVSEFALYDDELDMPVAYGSRNLVDGTVKNLDKSVAIVYYNRDVTNKMAFKKKIIYNGKKVVKQKNA